MCFDFYLIFEKIMKHHYISSVCFQLEMERSSTGAPSHRHFILAISSFVNPMDCFGWSRAFFNETLLELGAVRNYPWDTSKATSQIDLTMKYKKFCVNGVAMHSISIGYTDASYISFVLIISLNGK